MTNMHGLLSKKMIKKTLRARAYCCTENKSTRGKSVSGSMMSSVGNSSLMVGCLSSGHGTL